MPHLNDEFKIAAFDQIDDAVLIADPESGKLLWSNLAAQTLLGYSAEAITQLTIYDVVDDTPENIDARRAQIQANQQHHFGRRFYRHHSGKSIPVEVTASLITSPKPAIVSIARDISARVALEQEIFLFRAAMDASAVGFGIHQVAPPENPLIYVNPAGAKLVGRDLTDLVGQGHSFFAEQVSSEKDEDALSQAIQQGQSVTRVLHKRLPNGVHHWHRLTFSPIYDEHGQATHAIGVNIDVTDQVETEENLRQSEARFRTLAENTSTAIVIFQDGEARYANAAALDIVGGSLGSLNDNPEHIELFFGSIPEQAFVAPLRFEAEYEDNNGSNHFAQVEVLPVFLDGQPALMSSLVDLTERRQFEQALLVRQMQQEALARISQFALNATHAQPLYEFTVQQLTQIYDVPLIGIVNFIENCTRMKLQAQHGWDKIVDVSQSLELDMKSSIGDTLRSGAITVVEDFKTDSRYQPPASMVLKLGLRSCLSALIGDPDNPLGLIALHHNAPMRFNSDDLTFFNALAFLLAAAVRHYADRAALHASEQRFRLLTEGSPAVVFHSQMVNKTTDEYALYVSPNATRMLGREEIPTTVEEAVALLHPEDIALLFERFKQVIKIENELILEYRLFNQALDEYRWVLSVIKRVADSPDDAPEIIGYTLDITDRKNAEQALLDERAELARRVDERTSELRLVNAELARALRGKDEFLATMSHELRTPLNAILGLSEAMLDPELGELNTWQTNSANTIIESGQHLLNLINDVLDLAKIEAGRLDLISQWLEVDQVCEAAINFVRQEALKKQLKVTVELSDDAQHIYADDRRLKQILVNLLSNAVKFTPEGGQVGLTAKLADTEDHINFTVWDSGIGIAENQIQQLFKPFTQLDAGLARQHQGTGLGLALVGRLTQLHHGTISLESTPGKGSRFTVSIPYETNLQKAKLISPLHPQSQTEHALWPARILLAEDNAINASMIEDYLISKGFTVIWAEDGIQALDLTAKHIPDLILMDIHMPGVDGITAIKQIRATPPTENTPIIAITALAMPEDRIHCMDAGANEYLAKPVSLKALVSIINRLLGPPPPNP